MAKCSILIIPAVKRGWKSLLKTCNRCLAVRVSVRSVRDPCLERALRRAERRKCFRGKEEGVTEEAEGGHSSSVGRKSLQTFWEAWPTTALHLGTGVPMSLYTLVSWAPGSRGSWWLGSFKWCSCSLMQQTPAYFWHWTKCISSGRREMGK